MHIGNYGVQIDCFCWLLLPSVVIIVLIYGEEWESIPSSLPLHSLPPYF